MTGQAEQGGPETVRPSRSGARQASPGRIRLKRAGMVALRTLGSLAVTFLGLLIITFLIGRVLPVNGIREKVLAALRGGARSVVLPAANEADVEALRESIGEIPPVVLVRRVEEALSVALGRQGEQACKDL